MLAAMVHVLEPWLAALVSGLLLMVLTWVLSLRLRDTSIVDQVWGLGFVLAGAGAWWAGTTLRLWVLGLVALWGIRLSVHIHRRNRGRGEDPRYAAWRNQHGKSWPLRSLVTVFLLQGAILWVVASPVWVVLGYEGSAVGLLDYIGAGVVLFGVTFEAIADRQLKRLHVSGTIMDRGLWKYSRHPNYFGEAVVWWGFWIIALSHGAWWTIASPVAITLLLRFVSGVPMLEKKMQDRPGWADYARRTNAFVPWLQRK